MKKIEVGAQFKLMVDFMMALSETVIKSHYNIQKVEAKKIIYSAKCVVHGCPWKICSMFVSSWITVTRYCGEHTCGQFKLGKDHVMKTGEWIVTKSEGLFDESHNIPRKDHLTCQQVVGHGPPYRKCYNTKEIQAERIKGNHNVSFEVLSVYGK